MKYQLVKNGTDDYVLKYRDKIFTYKADIELMSKLQAAPKTARIKMLKDLAKEGMSLKEFTIEQKKEGKTYLDNTNKNELENAYIQDEMLSIIDDECKSIFGLRLTELITDIGIETEEEAKTFSNELGASLMGKTPSGR